MKKILLALLALLSLHTAFCKTYFIHNEQEFNNISQQIQPDDTIVIANGTYTPWSLIINTSGTATHPIIIQAATNGKVIFSGDAINLTTLKMPTGPANLILPATHQ